MEIHCYHRQGEGLGDVSTESAYTDPELHDWLIWAEENGSSFLRAIAEAALAADLKNYNVLRPTLLKLKQDDSQFPNSSVVVDHDV